MFVTNHNNGPTHASLLDYFVFVVFFARCNRSTWVCAVRGRPHVNLGLDCGLIKLMTSSTRHGDSGVHFFADVRADVYANRSRVETYRMAQHVCTLQIYSHANCPSISIAKLNSENRPRASESASNCTSLAHEKQKRTRSSGHHAVPMNGLITDSTCYHRTKLCLLAANCDKFMYGEKFSGLFFLMVRVESRPRDQSQPSRRCSAMKCFSIPRDFPKFGHISPMCYFAAKANAKSSTNTPEPSSDDPKGSKSPEGLDLRQDHVDQSRAVVVNFGARRRR